MLLAARTDIADVQSKTQLAGLVAVLACAAALSTGVASASTPSPAAYRDHVNSLCVSFEPRLKANNARAEQAHQSNDWAAWYRAMGQALQIALDENSRLESFPVPSSLTAKMTPALQILRRFDALARAAKADMATGNVSDFEANLTYAAQLASPLSKAFKSAGLTHCG